MSGIVGCYRHDGRPVEEAVREMAARIDYRGPDGGCVWADEAVGLGYQLL